MTPQKPTRVLVVDDHPSVRAGLLALLRTEPGLEPVAAARGVEDAVNENRCHLPDLVLADYLMRDGDGIRLCRLLKRDHRPPTVVIHTAFSGAALTIAARVAGADGLVDKGYTSEGLLAILRSVAAGDTVLPPPVPEAMSTIGSQLADEDLPVLGMLVAGIPATEIAHTMQVTPAALDSRIAGILDTIHPPAG